MSAICSVKIEALGEGGEENGGIIPVESLELVHNLDFFAHGEG